MRHNHHHARTRTSIYMWHVDVGVPPAQPAPTLRPCHSQPRQSATRSGPSTHAWRAHILCTYAASISIIYGSYTCHLTPVSKRASEGFRGGPLLHLCAQPNTTNFHNWPAAGPLRSNTRSDHTGTVRARRPAFYIYIYIYMYIYIFEYVHI